MLPILAFYTILLTSSRSNSVAAFNSQIPRKIPSSCSLLQMSSNTNSNLNAAGVSTMNILRVEDQVGSGSYGTVHVCSLPGDPSPVICKRAWTEDEFRERGAKKPTERAARAKHYFDVERHCFEKMGKSPPHISTFLGVFRDEQGREWMAFQMVTQKDGKTPALTLSDIIELDWEIQHQSDHHHLFMVQQALGLDKDATFADTLDVSMGSVLQSLQFIHSRGIVHRDLKPGNILLNPSTGSFLLIDFGSAADMEPIKMLFGKRRIGLENENVVAISPVYTAPELFIKPEQSPLNFDVFSAALIFCQLLFNLLDEATDAGFHQQLEEAQWDLDSWLSRTLTSKVRPAGIEDGLDYLAERPGLWYLLKRMLLKDPNQRISSSAALAQFEQIVEGSVDSEIDGAFFESVLSLQDSCEVPPDMNLVPRPLHYVATFERKQPLGLILAEAQDADLTDLNDEKTRRWNEATRSATPGQVFVKDVVKGGQADELGVIDTGDQLQGVGEFPLANRGFEKAVEMLERQPQSSKYIKLHFDRLSNREQIESGSDQSQTGSSSGGVIDQGAWSAAGRRRAQEDRLILCDVQEVVLMAVFDGHAGDAASKSAAQVVPEIFTSELKSGQVTARQALEMAWETTCTSYRHGCDEMGSCIADYDRMEGILLANTGATDVVAGTTAAVAAITENEISVLNCGDSRTLFLDPQGKVRFATQDHSPETERGRLEKGVESGLDYSLPKCSMSRWFLPVGDMTYAVARSLEGSFATSKGIVSHPDVTSLRRESGFVLVASDGLFEVLDNEQVGRELAKLQSIGYSAADAAKKLCSIAIDRGSSDNVSVVVAYMN